MPPLDSYLWTFATVLFLLLLGLGLGLGLHAWIKVIECWKGKSFDLTKFVTQEQLAVMKSDRDLQIKLTFELQTVKLDHITKTLDRLDQDLRRVSGDMPSLHHAIGVVEGRDDAEDRLRRPQ